MYRRFLSSAFLSALLLAPPADAAPAADSSPALTKRSVRGGKAKKTRKRTVKTTDAPQIARAKTILPEAHPEAYASFVQKLDEMAKQNIFDFCPPMGVVLNATGDEFAAVEWMKKAAGEGHIAALQYMADIELGNAPADELQSPRLKKAYQDMRRAADQGYSPAKCSVVLCLQYGVGVKKDEAAARKYMYEACKSGAYIPRLRWLIMEDRLKTYEDRERAEVKSEIERGNHHVAYYVALLATHEADRIDWLEKAAKMGSPEAYQGLSAILSHHGSAKESYDLLKKAATLHNPDALFVLGSMLMPSSKVAAVRELGITPDNAAGLHFMRLAAMLRQKEALFVMGRSYYLGENELPQDKVRAYRHFSTGASCHHAPSLAAAGYMLLRGEGVEQDTKKGMQQMTLAVRARYPYAMVLLAYAHYKGLGVPADAGKAVELLEQAAVMGFPQAYVDLAYVTAKGGPGKKPDPIMADSYMRIGAGYLKEEAQRYYDQLEKAGEWEPVP